MKKSIIILSSIISLSVLATSCGSTNKLANTINTVQQINNIASTASELSGVLGGTLGLDQSQKSSLTGILTDYITGTNGISGLASSNASQYLSKLAGINSNALSSIKGILNAAQYAKLLGIGVKSNSTSSLINNLTGGSNLSTGALSVLSGLLSK